MALRKSRYFRASNRLPLPGMIAPGARHTGGTATHAAHCSGITPSAAANFFSTTKEKIAAL
jgi:hypothetical protein